ncbi:MAG: DsbA family protein [Myxococcota bacterium]
MRIPVQLPPVTRRQWMGGGLAAAAWLATGCSRGKGDADPNYDKGLPGPGDVDGKLSRIIPGKRRPATYTMDAPAAVKGAASPLVTIVEYSDFQCPFCGTLASALHELVSAYPDDVRIVFRQFPLAFHKQAEPAARAVIAAGRQQRFWAMHDVLFANRSKLSDEALPEYADGVGLSRKTFEADFADAAVAKRVADEMAQGRKLGVSGTPSMFINGFFVGGMLEPDKLTEVVDGERRVAEALIEAGSKREEVYARFMRAAGAK